MRSRIGKPNLGLGRYAGDWWNRSESDTDCSMPIACQIGRLVLGSTPRFRSFQECVQIAIAVGLPVSKWWQSLAKRQDRLGLSVGSWWLST